MKDELELKLQNDFPFMWQRHEEGQDLYRRWGCECSDGWYGIIHDACQAVADAYEEGMDFDDALALAKENGFAEADPTADLEGLDMVRKISSTIRGDVSVTDKLPLNDMKQISLSNVHLK